jgi:tellurite resistance protein TerC
VFGQFAGGCGRHDEARSQGFRPILAFLTQSARPTRSEPGARDAASGLVVFATQGFVMITALMYAHSNAPAVVESSAGMPLLYAGFFVFVLALLALDLGVFHRESHVVSLREAAIWTGVWTSLALGFTGFVYLAYERHWLGLGLDVPVVGRPGETSILTGLAAAEQYMTGYFVEWSLALDNLFVISIVFTYFAVPPKYQHRVLFWGIIGAIVMRAIMIALGAALIQRFDWITYVFGGFLILTACKLALAGQEGVHPDRNLLVRLVRWVMPVTAHYDGQRFFTRVSGSDGVIRRAATPLFLALIVVEFTDLIFAVDSVPAIFAITGDPFIVLTSNVFAVLGLRSLYFLLADVIRRFRFLKPALVMILFFVGTKLLLIHTDLKIDPAVSLGVVAGLLGAGVAASLAFPRPREVVP